MSIEHSDSLLQGALLCASLNWRIFPLKPFSKIPLLPHSWPELATTDITQITQWWTEHPQANIAVVAGTELCIVDVDQKDGKDGWAQVGLFIDQNTIWSATPNGGWHFYYEAPSCPTHGLPGVDVQRGNAYVVAPPSHLQGAPWDDPVAYTWGRAPGPPWEPGILTVPEQLLAALVAPSVPRETDAECPLLLAPELVPPWPQDQLDPKHLTFLHTGQVEGFPSRSEVLHSLTVRLYRLGYDDAAVLSLLMQADHTRDTALEHRGGDYDRAVAYLWDGCKKVRHERTRDAQEVFGPVVGSPQAETLDQLRARAARLAPMDNPRDILQDLALLTELDAIDEDQILGILKNQGFTLQNLRKTLTKYRKQAAAKGKTGRGPQWRHVVGEDDRPLGTLENLKALLEHKRCVVRHNLMNHHIDLDCPGEAYLEEERLNAQLTRLRSWAAETRLPLETVKEQVAMLAQANAYHPFQEYIEQAPWDGTGRLRAVLDTIQVPSDKEDLRDLLVSRWLLSIVASTYTYGNRPPRGVLTFTGSQHQGKTTWLYYLVPKGMYHQGLILRPGDRDSATKGLRYLIAEIGEIGSTFKRSDMDQLKGYIGQREDNYRLAYAHEESRWPRRTVFAASSNDVELLHDQTGNSRWWVLPTEGFDLDAMEQLWEPEGRGVALQQFWAEVKEMYDRGDAWDLTDLELVRLERHLEHHLEESAIETVLRDTYEWEEYAPVNGYPMAKPVKEIQRDMGWTRPFNGVELRLLRGALRKLTGQREGLARRVTLATKDGEQVTDPNWRPSGRTARCWYVPRLSPARADEGGPFRPTP